MTRDKDGLTCTCEWTRWNQQPHYPDVVEVLAKVDPLCPLHGDERDTSVGKSLTDCRLCGSGIAVNGLCHACRSEMPDRDTSIGPFRMDDQTRVALAAWEALQPDPDLDYGDWQAKQAYEKHVANQERQERAGTPPSAVTAAGEALSAPQQTSLYDVLLDRLAREGRQPPPMTAEQAERFFDQRHDRRVDRRDWNDPQ